jgi:hypothetical protein
MKHYFSEVRNICVEARVERTRWSHIPITFSEEDVRLKGLPHNDALVIEANIAKPATGEGMDKSTLAHTQIQIIIIHFLPSPIPPIPNG